MAILMNPDRKTLKKDLSALTIDRSATTSQRPTSRRGVLLGLFLVFGILLGAVASPYLKDLIPQSLRAKEVSVVLAVRQSSGGPLPTLSAGGYVIARYQVEVGSKITGRVVALEIKEGDTVRAGQVIARLEDFELRAQVRQAEANVAAARARLLELETGSRPQEIERAKAEVTRTAADLKHSELILQRTERLVRDKVLEDQSLDDARARYDMALAANRAATENYELVRIGPRDESIQLARAQLQQAQAELAFDTAQFDNTIIRAPVSGTILDRYVDVGEMVTTGFTSDRGAKQALVSIADLMDLQVELDISEADIARVHLDQVVQIQPDAYQDRTYPGVVEYIASVADRQKATIQVKVKVEQPDHYLRPDMGAKVTFYEQGATPPGGAGVVLVPKAAIVSQNGSPVVYLVQDSKVVVQEIGVGAERGDQVEVLTGLQGGEGVITTGQERLAAGDTVVVR